MNERGLPGIKKMVFKVPAVLHCVGGGIRGVGGAAPLLLSLPLLCCHCHCGGDGGHVPTVLAAAVVVFVPMLSLPLCPCPCCHHQHCRHSGQPIVLVVPGSWWLVVVGLWVG